MEQLHTLFDLGIKKSSLAERKLEITHPKTQIVALPGSGASSLIFKTLSLLKPSTYLYIDLNDYRIDKKALETNLHAFCEEKKIQTLALEGFDGSFELPPLPQIILSNVRALELEHFETLYLMPLDFEEFLALDNRYDSMDTALSHFLQIGGFPELIQIPQANRQRYLQSLLKLALSPLELAIMAYASRQLGHKASPFQIFERLKQDMKLSKDNFYKTFYELIEKRWILWLEKYEHPKATKKIYMIDFAIKGALSFNKNFSKLFESLIFLELTKAGNELYYDEGIDFYLPQEDRVVLALPFVNDSSLFTIMEKIEGWLIHNGVQKMEVVTMNSESQLHHPFLTVEMIPFTRWALIES